MSKVQLGSELKESFQWAPNEYIRLLRQNEAGSIYRVRAIHVTKTRNDVEFTEEELRAAARSLGYRPLNLNHVPPPLAFPENRVIDAEFEDARVEALIAVRDPSIMLMIETKKIVAVSVEAQYRSADMVCDQTTCWWQIHGVTFTGLALLTPGVEPGDPLASIVMKKHGASAPDRPASFAGMTSREVDTKLNEGGVLMEKKEATPPLEPNKETKPAPTETATQPAPVATTQPTVQESAPTSTEKAEGVESTKPAVETATEVRVEVDASKALDQSHCAQTILAEVRKVGAKVDSLEGQVKLLREQRRKGTRRA